MTLCLGEADSNSLYLELKRNWTGLLVGPRFRAWFQVWKSEKDGNLHQRLTSLMMKDGNLIQTEHLLQRLLSPGVEKVCTIYLALPNGQGLPQSLPMALVMPALERVLTI